MISCTCQRHLSKRKECVTILPKVLILLAKLMQNSHQQVCSNESFMIQWSMAYAVTNGIMVVSWCHGNHVVMVHCKAMMASNGHKDIYQVTYYYIEGIHVQKLVAVGGMASCLDAKQMYLGTFWKFVSNILCSDRQNNGSPPSWVNLLLLVLYWKRYSKNILCSLCRVKYWCHPTYDGLTSEEEWMTKHSKKWLLVWDIYQYHVPAFLIFIKIIILAPSFNII